MDKTERTLKLRALELGGKCKLLNLCKNLNSWESKHTKKKSRSLHTKIIKSFRENAWIILRISYYNLDLWKSWLRYNQAKGYNCWAQDGGKGDHAEDGVVCCLEVSNHEQLMNSPGHIDWLLKWSNNLFFVCSINLIGYFMPLRIVIIKAGAASGM